MKVGRTYTILASLLLALAYAGCGDDAGGPSKKGCTTNDDCSGATVCVAGTCQPAPDAVTGDTGGPDDTAAPEDPGTEPPKDVVVPEDQKTTEDPGKPFDPGPAPDLIPDTTDPDVKEVTPADGAVNVAANVKIKLVFTEPVKNVVSNSIELTDPSGTVLELQITKKCGDPHCAEWEVTPKAPLWLVSPYVLTVNFPHQVIMDQAGNKMEGIREYEFFTAPPPDLGKYDALAKKYAPVVRLTTESATKAHLDIPHKIDFDGNWDVKDNVASLDAAKELVAAGYYSVLESESHVFIHYFWFWSRRENPAQGEQFDSDSSGALVVLAKWPEEKPVEVMTWFKKKGGDYVRAFVTKESGILPEGTDKANAGVDGVYPLAELFPEGRFDAFLPSSKHESCLWLSQGNSAACELTPGEKPSNPLKLTPAASKGTAIKKVGSKWVLDTELAYELVDALPIVWPRRMEHETLFDDSTATYALEKDKEATLATFPKFWIDAAGEASDGRAPYAVIWAPGDLSQYDDIVQGAFFFDPPRFMVERHKTSYVKTEFDPKEKTGMSRLFCFNPYVGLDRRGSSEVCP